MILDYLGSLPEIGKTCEDFRLEVLNTWFRNISFPPENFCYTPQYQEKLRIIKAAVAICDKFNIDSLEREKETLTNSINLLETMDFVRDSMKFSSKIIHIRNAFYSAKNQLIDALRLLGNPEKGRLNESIHNLLEGCYYSAVAMAVSAIEFRLLQLMKSRNPEAKLEEKTLGELIGEYLRNKTTYQNVIPKKHEPLLELSNTYRIFSVHPKTEEINKRVAESILNLTLEFLLDKKIQAKSAIATMNG